MTAFSRVVSILSIAMALCIAVPAFAESAPVYDADSFPQQFDTGPDQDRDLPPPPPGQEGAYVPNQGSDGMASTSGSSIDQRVKRVEQQVNNMQNNDAAARIDSLQNQVQSLRGQVDQLTHQLQLMQNQQKDMLSDVDKRLAQKMASAPSKTVPSTDSTAADASNDNAPATKSIRKAAKLASKTTVAAADNAGVTPTADNTAANDSSSKSSDDQPNVAEEQQIYQTAYNFIKAKKYDDAVNTLQNMLKKYPSGQFASNAHYWLGELYNLMSKNDQALTEFSTVVEHYPDSPRVSDAQLKVGLIYASQTKWSDAKNAFKKVINHYPGSASARLASEQLKQIRTAGH